MITRKIDYALRVILFLAKQKGRIVTTADMGARIDVPAKFLAKIVNLLSKAGIIEAERGKAGGIRLREGNISIKKVVLLLEPGFVMNKCMMTGFACKLKKACPIHPIIRQIQTDIMDRFERTDLWQLANA